MNEYIDSIKIKCYVKLQTGYIEFEEFKKFVEEGYLILDQIEGKEVSLYSENEIIANGKIIHVNGRYGLQVTEIY